MRSANTADDCFVWITQQTLTIRLSSIHDKIKLLLYGLFGAVCVCLCVVGGLGLRICGNFWDFQIDLDQKSLTGCIRKSLTPEDCRNLKFLYAGKKKESMRRNTQILADELHIYLLQYRNQFFSKANIIPRYRNHSIKLPPSLYDARNSTITPPPATQQIKRTNHSNPPIHTPFERSWGTYRRPYLEHQDATHAWTRTACLRQFEETSNAL